LAVEMVVRRYLSKTVPSQPCQDCHEYYDIPSQPCQDCHEYYDIFTVLQPQAKLLKISSIIYSKKVK